MQQFECNQFRQKCLSNHKEPDPGYLDDDALVPQKSPFSSVDRLQIEHGQLNKTTVFTLVDVSLSETALLSTLFSGWFARLGRNGLDVAAAVVVALAVAVPWI